MTLPCFKLAAAGALALATLGSPALAKDAAAPDHATMEKTVGAFYAKMSAGKTADLVKTSIYTFNVDLQVRSSRSCLAPPSGLTATFPPTGGKGLQFPALRGRALNPDGGTFSSSP